VARRLQDLQHRIGILRAASGVGRAAQGSVARTAAAGPVNGLDAPGASAAARVVVLPGGPDGLGPAPPAPATRRARDRRMTQRDRRQGERDRRHVRQDRRRGRADHRPPEQRVDRRAGAADRRGAGRDRREGTDRRHPALTRHRRRLDLLTAGWALQAIGWLALLGSAAVVR
jgi:hypothetical protein